MEQSETTSTDLSTIIISLLKGVLYRDTAEPQWEALQKLQARVRDYVLLLGLDLVIDEAEGYAFLKSKVAPEQDRPIPRLIARRPLSFPVSLLLALLRKKLAEFDAGGSETRLVLTKDEIVELMRVFMPDSTDQAKLIDQIDAHVNKIVDLGFLRPLKVSAGPQSFEVRRILKAFVDAQWLSDFDAKLEEYRKSLSDPAENGAS